MPSSAWSIACAALFVASCAAQSNNYEKQAISLEYEKESGLPTFGTLNGTVTELDTLPSSINLNRTEAVLSCSSGFISINLLFRQPFFGIVYADYDRNSACKISGNGKLEERIQLPLKGCGTFQSPARVFTNNIVVRFHPGLEIDGDEVITVICRYPPPIVPPPLIPESLILPDAPVLGAIQPLREFEILLIICAIIFLALLLLGMGCSYYCLKKRNIKVVRRRPLSTLGSDVTKISEPVSMFGGLKIPRAHAIDADASVDMTESVKTDFPSDVASLQSEEEYTSAYSDKMCILQEGVVAPAVRPPPIPDFDVNMIVKYGDGQFTPMMSTASSESETVLNAQEQYLTTILERTETNTLETLERIRKAKAAAGPPPVHARLNIKNRQLSDASDVDTTSEYSREGTEFSEQEIELESRQLRNFAMDSELRHAEESEAGRAATGAAGHGQQQGGARYAAALVGGHAHAQQHEHVSMHQQHDSMEEYHDDRDISVMEYTMEGAHHTTAVQNNFDVLIRIVNNDLGDYSYGGATDDDVSSVFTEEERIAIRRVLQEDVQLQSELKRTTARESYHLLRDNQMIKELVEPQKWDVLIRILNNGGDASYAVSERRPSSGTSISGRYSFAEDGRMVSADGYSIGGRSSSNYLETRSAADRSEAEITEFHHYTSATSTMEKKHYSEE